jgi:hypothetical protein
MAASHLLRCPVTGRLINAILALMADDPQTAETYAQAAVGNATPLRREAITIHLRDLAAAQPEHHEAIANSSRSSLTPTRRTELANPPGQHAESGQARQPQGEPMATASRSGGGAVRRRTG